MQDTSIKGNGTSRFIKGASNFPSSFEEFRRQIMAGTLTADIGLNPAGCDVVGTALSKANLLTDQTATLLDLTGSSTVNEAFEKIAKWKGAANGLAELGSDGKVLKTQLPPVEKPDLSKYVLKTDKGAANGVAPLNNLRKINDEFLWKIEPTAPGDIHIESNFAIVAKPPIVRMYRSGNFKVLSLRDAELKVTNENETFGYLNVVNLEYWSDYLTFSIQNPLKNSSNILYDKFYFTCYQLNGENLILYTPAVHVSDLSLRNGDKVSFGLCIMYYDP